MSVETIPRCWCRSNVGRQTVPHRRTSDGECSIAKTKSGARDDEVSTSCRAESDASGHSCKAFVGLIIRAKMIGGGDPFYLKF